MLPKTVQIVIDALLGPTGTSDPGLRAAVFEKTRKNAGDMSAILSAALDLRGFVDKIDQRPWTVSDEDFSNLLKAGYSEDQIFELTLAASAGAGVRRFEAGLWALEQEQELSK